MDKPLVCIHNDGSVDVIVNRKCFTLSGLVEMPDLSGKKIPPKHVSILEFIKELKRADVVSFFGDKGAPILYESVDTTLEDSELS